MSKLDSLHTTSIEHVQRMSVEDWREILVNKQDILHFPVGVGWWIEDCRLVAADLGFGMVEVSKDAVSVARIKSHYYALMENNVRSREQR